MNCEEEREVPPWVAGMIERLEHFRGRLDHLDERLDRIEQRLALSIAKESYLVEEAAERLNRKPWTVRQWCNKGQVKGAKKVRGKGRTGEWRIPHEELLRLQNDGPLPVGTCQAA